MRGTPDSRGTKYSLRRPWVRRRHSGTVDTVANDDAPRRPQTSAQVGVPQFEHGQYTFEGEVERLGAFASGARRVRGPKRVVAFGLVLLFVVPIVLGAVVQVVIALTR